MKKCMLLFLSLFTLLIFTHVEAASFSLSSGTKQVSPGETFSVRVGGEAIGRVNLSVSNGTLSTSSVWVEENYVNVNATAGESGVVVVTATPVVGFSDADANLYNPGARSVSVTIVTNSSNPSTSNPNSGTSNSNSETKPSTGSTTQKKSGNNDLVSLRIKEGTLSPEFNNKKLEYNLNLTSDTKKITIEGKTSDTKAKVEGIGKREVHPGNNDIEVIVTAENGAKKTYKIHVYVEEEPELYLDYLEKQIGIIKNEKDISTPSGFKKEKMTINDKEISVFTKENLVLVYGQNENKEKNFYVFDKEKNTLISTCIPIEIKGHIYYIIDAQQEKGTILENLTLAEKEIPCYTYQEDNNYCFMNTINEEGKTEKYLYEKSEGTMQLFPTFLTSCEQIETKKTIFPYVLSVILFLMLGGVFFLFLKEKRGGQHEKA